MAHAHRQLDDDRLAIVQHPPEIEPMTVLRVTFRRGEGCCEHDLAREVVAYYDTVGELLWEYDPSPTTTPPVVVS